MHLGTEPGFTAIKSVAGYDLKGQAVLFDPLDHLPAQLDLGGELTILRDAQALALVGFVLGKPTLRQKQLTIHPGPEVVLGMHITEECAYLAHLDFAQSPVVLAPCSCGLGTGFLVGALIEEEEDTALLEIRVVDNLLLDLPDRAAGIPGGVRDEMLDVLDRHVAHTSDVGEVALSLKAQLRGEIAQSIVAGVSGIGSERPGEALPELV